MMVLINKTIELAASLLLVAGLYILSLGKTYDLRVIS